MGVLKSACSLAFLASAASAREHNTNLRTGQVEAAWQGSISSKGDSDWAGSGVPDNSGRPARADGSSTSPDRSSSITSKTSKTSKSRKHKSNKRTSVSNMSYSSSGSKDKILTPADGWASASPVDVDGWAPSLRTPSSEPEPSPSPSLPPVPSEPPTPPPSPGPDPKPDIPGCVDLQRYRAMEADVATIASRIDTDVDRSHFFGGALRLAAHDFMDYDQNSDDVMGMDGCLDWDSHSNAGLSSLWNEHSALHKLHADKYGDISIADYWIVVANAVVKLTSVGSGLDLVSTFFWGRKDRDDCHGSAERLPTTQDCRQVEGVFMDRMGLTWRDAVALLGAHTLGRGHSEFSGHHGKWVPNESLAQIFDKRYYHELMMRSWSVRKIKTTDPPQSDYITGNPNSSNPKMMLNTDVCLVWDIDEDVNCCTRTDLFRTNGDSHCAQDEDKQCPLYGAGNPRREAAEAVQEYLGAPGEMDNNEAFYEAFKLAWLKATMNGMHDLHPIKESSCVMSAEA